jgi:predicted DNA-binding protein
MAMLNISLTADLEQRLHALAARTGVAPEAALHEAIARYIEDQEDITDAIEVMARDEPVWTMEDIREGRDLVGH